MNKNFVEELRWRGMIHDVMPDTEQHLNEKMRTAYVGIDPTADSLHIGHLVSIMMLCHFQRCGHRPIALLGGATGMIGDPSGKSQERNLLDEATLKRNEEAIQQQLNRFLQFSSNEANEALQLNNYDWMKPYRFLDFIRDIGKHITVNYMMAKDSVKKRLTGESAEGMSFTEFSYQLVQGYDFLHLYKTYDCTLQMGGSDQWGNITTGTELIRRVEAGKAYALTCPLITKADGSKFGKTESGNIWLDSDKTSPFEFYQYWMNTGDEEAERYIKIFTFLEKDTIEALVQNHQKAPDQRMLQERLAVEVTTMVHGETELKRAQGATKILFGNSTKDDLELLDDKSLKNLFKGIPIVSLPQEELQTGLDMIAALSAKTKFLNSNAEARRALNEGSISVNKEKISADYLLTEKDILSNGLILLQRGKKKYFMIEVVNAK